MNAMIPATATVAQWAAHIAACWSVGAKAIVETGRMISVAKEQLPHGEFLAMVETALPFSSSTAQRLMVIASDARLSNAAHVQHLPPSWGTLYELTKLDDNQFAAKIADGTIRPDVERAEIVSFRKAARQAPAVEAYKARVDAGCTLDDLTALADSGYQAGAISADPNWQYETWSDKGKDRSPDQHYDTDNLAGILKLAPIVRRLAAPNSVLHLWCLDCMLPQAVEVIEALGFKFIKVGFNWIKLNPSGDGRFMGLGKWTRDGAELCLFATKGQPVRRDAGVRQVIEAPIGKHSEKPKESHSRIEALTAGPYLELYARELRKGWTCWGDEIPRTLFQRAIETIDVASTPIAGVTVLPSGENSVRLVSESDESDLPAFLVRNPDNSFPFVPRVSPIETAGGKG